MLYLVCYRLQYDVITFMKVCLKFPSFKDSRDGALAQIHALYLKFLSAYCDFYIFWIQL